MNIIFQINGGLGKSVMATAVCKSIKEKYPNDKLIVITGYPDIFLNNPNVDRCLSHNELKYFYQDYIKSKDFIYLGQEPYLTNQYIKREKNLIEIWCDMYDLPVTLMAGELFLTKREIDFFSKKYVFEKPILALQTSGSAGDLMYNWSRDIPPKLAKSIIEKYSSEYAIVHIKGENQITYEGTIPFTDGIRAVAVILTMSQKRIFMDSSCQHIAAALGLPSNVFWVTTDPLVFGYNTHNNILAEKETKKVSLPHSVLSKYELVSNLSDFPYYNESEIFNEVQVLNSII